MNWNGCGKKQLWLILKDRKARKTLAEYECQLFNYKYTDPTEEGSKDKQVIIGLASSCMSYKIKTYLRSPHAETLDVANAQLLNLLSLGYTTALRVSDWHPSQHSQCGIWGKRNSSEACFSLTTSVSPTHYCSISVSYSSITCSWHDKHILRPNYQETQVSPPTSHQMVWLFLYSILNMILSWAKFRFYPLSCKSVVAGKFPARFRLSTEREERMNMTDFN